MSWGVESPGCISRLEGLPDAPPLPSPDTVGVLCQLQQAGPSVDPTALHSGPAPSASRIKPHGESNNMDIDANSDADHQNDPGQGKAEQPGVEAGDVFMGENDEHRKEGADEQAGPDDRTAKVDNAAEPGQGPGANTPPPTQGEDKDNDEDKEEIDKALEKGSTNADSHHSLSVATQATAAAAPTIEEAPVSPPKKKVTWDEDSPTRCSSQKAKKSCVTYTKAEPDNGDVIASQAEGWTKGKGKVAIPKALTSLSTQPQNPVFFKRVNWGSVLYWVDHVEKQTRPIVST